MSNDADILISTTGLERTFRLGKVDLPVLRGVDLTVRRGEFVGLYGHSGSGKSTLLHILGLLDAPDGGSIILDGEDVATLSAARRNQIRCEDIGFVFQFYHLLPELTVLENAMLPAMIGASWPKFRRNKKEISARATELLDELGLGERLKHRPRELSGGERQRVAIARSLLHGPKLLLADEPTGNLDSHTGQSIMDTLLRYHRDHGQTILMVTHDDDLASQVERVIHLRDGQIQPHQG
ncbi:MAG: ABC transporter ATP-binding protein [Phycisphaerales bacterium]|nr:ABC transporter ATP-binding protein [Phycisphaerales bacterium]